jgi:predicted lysophospholipase L1 biosynthesis ABC-type transport system permease subunit
MFFIQSIGALFIVTLSIGLPLLLPLVNKTKTSFTKIVLWFLPFIGFLIFIAHSVSPNKNIGLFFALAILVVISMIFIIGRLVLKGVDFSGHLKKLSLSLAIKNIIRQNKTSLTLFSAILLCTTFFTLIPQVGSSLSELLNKSVEDRPRFFVVDAKEEQLDSLKTQIKTLGADLENIAPMIRGRVIKINDIDFKQHAIKNKDEKEKIDENELKNRAVNLSYRNSIKKSEEIVEGREFGGRYDSPDFSKPIELSVEKRYAKRRGIKLGDSITFDVLGIELHTVVVNIRSVKWMEFTPNFFFIMQEGVLNDAPKTILATISHGDYDASRFLIQLTDSFPSLTIIDVKNLFETFSKLVDSVTIITDRMSFYSIVIGLLMSFIIIRYQLNLQKNNILRLKMIGVDNKTIKKSLLIEFGLVTFVASFIGIILGSTASLIISDMLFESYWDIRLEVLLSYFLFIPILTMFVVYIFSNKIIKQKENVLFGE